MYGPPLEEPVYCYPVGPPGPQGPAGPNSVAGLVTAGSNITITGAGTPTSPYVLSASGTISGNITGLIVAGTNITLSGSGTSASPYVINATGGGVTSFNSRSGAVSLVSSDVTGALGYTPAQPVNPTSHEWVNSINSSGVPQLSQPGFADISGTISPSQVPTLNQNTTGQAGTVATIAGLITAGTNITITGSGNPYTINSSGGVTSFNTRTGAVTLTSSDVVSALGYTPSTPVTPVSHQWVNSINSSGVPQLSQPSFADISGTISPSQVPTLNQNTTGQAGTVATIAGLLVAGTNITLTGSGAPYTISSSGGSGVTSITAGTGLSGGTITSTGTIAIANTSVTAGSYNYASITVNAQGQITAASSGSPVTSVAMSVPSFLSVSGSPITSSGTLAVTLNNENANTFFAGPSSGSANTPSFRAIVPSDVPTLNQNTTGQAGTVATIAGLLVAGSNITLSGSGNPYTISATGAGVTSVAMTVPSFLSVSGSPITSSGTLAVSLTTQSANTVFAGPSSGSALAPTFRSLVPADVPTLNQNTTGQAGTVATIAGLVAAGTNVSLTGSGTSASPYTVAANAVTSVAMTVPSEFSVSGSPITSSGTLAVTKNNQNANLVYAGPTSGGAAAPTFRSIVVADVPTLNQNTTGQAATVATINGLIAAGANITLTGSGSPYTIASNTSGTVTSITAGTGLSGGTITTSGTIALANTAVTAGSYTYASITVNAQGQLTAASSGTAPVTSVSGTSGEITSTGGTTPVLALATTAVTPGSYTFSSLTVDAYGRLIAASSGAPVTSVAMTVPSFLSVSGSPITTTGTLAVSLATQSANTFFAGPSTGAAAAPTFRAMVAGDVPTLNQNTTGQAGTVATINGHIAAGTNITLTGSGTTASPYTISSSGGSGSAGDRLAKLVNTEISVTGATTATINTMHKCSGTSSNYTVTLPSASGNAGNFVAFRMLPQQSLSVFVTLDAGSGCNIDGQSTTLSASLTSTATTVSVSAVIGPATGNFILQIASEQVLVTAGNGTTSLTVIRGVNGTTAALHVNGATIDYQRTRLMWAGEVAELLCDGTSWFKVSGKSIPFVTVAVNGSQQNITGSTSYQLVLANVVIGLPSMLSSNSIFIPRSNPYNFTCQITATGCGAQLYMTPVSTYSGSGATIAINSVATSTNGSISLNPASQILNMCSGDAISSYIYTNGNAAILAYPQPNLLEMQEICQW